MKLLEDPVVQSQRQAVREQIHVSAPVHLASKGSQVPRKPISTQETDTNAPLTFSNSKVAEAHALFLNGDISLKEISLLVSSFTDEELWQYFSQNTNIDQSLLYESLNPIEDLRRLADIWYSPVSYEPPSASSSFNIKLASSPLKVGGLNALKSNFNQHVRQIYAYINLPTDYAKSFFYVKWVNVEQEALWSLDRYTVENTPQETQQIWTRFKSSWPAGRYQLEVYNADGLTLIAVQRYTVSN